MKPNFALNLSPDGIGLLHRAAGGWHSVGEAKLDDPALDETLAYLRRTAAGLDARGIATKLIIPPSQVLYISLHAPGPSDEEREHQIRAALKGLTPYAVEDIVFDWQAQGDEVQVAAVAQETLEEAENFAARHRFNPVSFAAYSDGSKFDGEAFFGASSRADRFLEDGEEVERESVAVGIAAQSVFAEREPEPLLPAETGRENDENVAAFVTTRAGSPVAGAPAGQDLPPSRLTIPPDSTEMPETASGVERNLPEQTGNHPGPEYTVRSADAGQFSGLGAARPVRASARKRAVFVAAGLVVLLLAAAVIAPLSMPRLPGLQDAQTELPEDPSVTEGGSSVPGLSTAPPVRPSFAPITIVEEFRHATLDPLGRNHDAVALPQPDTVPESGQPVSWPGPPAAGTPFELDERGLVIPSASGAPNPDGVLVFAGPPPARSVPRPEVDSSAFISDGSGAAPGLGLARFRPKSRPANLMERFERSRFAGLTRAELALRRPAPRPPSPQSDPDIIAGLPEILIARSAHPPLRPDNLAEAAASARLGAEATRKPARVRTISPRIPVSASVARQATIENAIDLRRITLIGVSGSSGKQRALVRLRNGRVRSVVVGDNLDGGRVAAIESDALRYIKSGRSITLRMPDI